jgi:hypothetical protein
VTITEARAVNTLLNWITGRRPFNYPGPPLPTSAEALEAAQILAAKAEKALMAGWSPVRLGAAWPAVPPVERDSYREIPAADQDGGS